MDFANILANFSVCELRNTLQIQLYVTKVILSNLYLYWRSRNFLSCRGLMDVAAAN